jgi:hypothetical protein
MSESSKTRTLCTFWRDRGVQTFAVVANKFAAPGWPDRYVHSKVWHGFIEFKDGDGSLSKIQRHRIEALNLDVPGSAFCVRHNVESKSVVIEDFDGNTLAADVSWRELLAVLQKLAKDMVDD